MNYWPFNTNISGGVNRNQKVEAIDVAELTETLVLFGMETVRARV